ncbi:globin domain-containing protein [Streptomyces sp. DSM 44917]|uniref:nitric oxide dioxygenase n=1 Tax=Streptomyces boetiae TaxID=3075541 RepID=A0ABU2L685_9ACTN|nr:globin domain-containing protein [Streptomyces sp. DSM 44917]MDT0307075.1 globin domain-containing protein [Streptomyces sp. DSM 44917]
MTAISADDGATTTGSGTPGEYEGIPGVRGQATPGGRPRGRAAGPAGGAADRGAETPAEHPPHAPAGRSGNGVPSRDAVVIRGTLAEIEPIADEVTSYFYALLFVHNPGLREMFPAAMDTQRDRLFGALLTAAEHIDDTVTLTEYLSHLGRGHRKYGTRPEHYPAVGECLMAALERHAPATWGPEAEAAWVRAYTAISQTMIDAAAEAELTAPAWWQAEIVAHERRTSHVAVVTVRPDQPYPYRAGQYCTLETPWWPRVWRHYSFASRPRPDGLLTFHVKSVPAGWVSRSLVHRARRGDVLRLGPSGGSMTLDAASGRGLVCVGGSTGIAPIKALVEEVAEHGVRRPVEVFFGANRDSELYDLDALLALERLHPWLSVRPVVAEYARRGIEGRLPDALRQFGPWRERDGYLAGPPQMIRKGVEALVTAGVPAERIRHDFPGRLVSAGG